MNTLSKASDHSVAGIPTTTWSSVVPPGTTGSSPWEWFTVIGSIKYPGYLFVEFFVSQYQGLSSKSRGLLPLACGHRETSYES